MIERYKKHKKKEDLEMSTLADYKDLKAPYNQYKSIKSNTILKGNKSNNASSKNPPTTTTNKNTLKGFINNSRG